MLLVLRGLSLLNRHRPRPPFSQCMIALGHSPLRGEDPFARLRAWPSNDLVGSSPKPERVALAQPQRVGRERSEGYLCFLPLPLFI